ncbi:hypothetical protein AHA02nite_11910 [Alkalibacillus haloalkaliphilus]|uniref:Uncharacterized protein n=1 Tax=Alkalibacillus haloalkaliphilus TaxID=94136 RepID=A0A511W2V4_9BACI|nr:hypothetical protein AHA02nite_11910 [Alkalibacillus haloalkaliphilus]
MTKFKGAISISNQDYIRQYMLEKRKRILEDNSRGTIKVYNNVGEPYYKPFRYFINKAGQSSAFK